MFVKELEITLENGMKISGELDLPERQGQWKTIILFHGSGPSDRHATVAFYLGEYIAESEIEDYLKIHLPEYSIPNSINRLENFPLNANGKVDRRRLAEYQKTDSVEIMSDKVLNIVLMIWEELLKNKVADLDENLFKIGADSLLAARFVAAINARCGIEVRMKEVFMNPSINALTKLVDKRKNTDIAEFVEEGEI